MCYIAFKNPRKKVKKFVVVECSLRLSYIYWIAARITTAAAIITVIILFAILICSYVDIVFVISIYIDIIVIAIIARDP